MPELRGLSGVDLIRLLEQLGFAQVRQRGSHVVLRRRTAAGEFGCVVPLHKELAIGTVAGILKQAQIDRDEFLKLKK